MTQQPHVVYQPVQQTNGLGLAGFIVSLIDSVPCSSDDGERHGSPGDQLVVLVDRTVGNGEAPPTTNESASTDQSTRCRAP